jgi:hypothetical protein
MRAERTTNIGGRARNAAEVYPELCGAA